MKKIIKITLVALFFVGCTQRLGDFTVMSTRNVDLNANYVKVENNVRGQDKKQIIIFIPTGTPNIESAIDQALKSVDGGAVMTDVSLTYKWFYIPYIYGEYIYEVEGDVWKKSNVDVGDFMNDSDKIYKAVQKNGEILLVENEQE
tara:strand:- start:231 stop:665 length:435 start_codon:yes stop_codon:yes gene_type:complete